MEPLIVTAEMATAWTASDPWSPAIDAIIAYWLLHEQLGEEEFAARQGGWSTMEDAELPLAREQHGDWWWWQASSPLSDLAAGFNRAFYRRFNLHESVTYLPERTKRVLTAGGLYRTHQRQRSMQVSSSVVWHVIGDGAEIERLLRRCAFVGSGHTRGYGQVARWRVESGGDARIARFHRPLPVAFAEAHDVAGAAMEWGLRPPVRNPASRTLCVMPPARPPESIDVGEVDFFDVVR